MPERVPESDVDEPRLVEIYPEGHVIKRDAESAFILGYFCRQQRYRIAQFLEEPENRLTLVPIYVGLKLEYLLTVAFPQIWVA